MQQYLYNAHAVVERWQILAVKILPCDNDIGNGRRGNDKGFLPYDGDDNDNEVVNKLQKVLDDNSSKWW